VLEVSGEEGVRSNQWHTDVTFVVSPPAITSLRVLVVPPYGGNTLIANSATAYSDLPKPLRVLADSLWALHTNDYDALPRTLHRVTVTVAGPVPVSVDGRRSYIVSGDDAAHYTPALT